MGFSFYPFLLMVSTSCMDHSLEEGEGAPGLTGPSRHFKGLGWWSRTHIVVSNQDRAVSFLFSGTEFNWFIPYHCQPDGTDMWC